MNEQESRILLMVWLAFTGLALTAITSVIIWAVRNKQFREQDHARYLPLEAEIVEL